MYTTDDCKSLFSDSSNFSVQDVEAQLKALLFGRKDSTASSSGNNSPAISSPRSKCKNSSAISSPRSKCKNSSAISSPRSK